MTFRVAEARLEISVWA